MWSHEVQPWFHSCRIELPEYDQIVTDGWVGGWVDMIGIVTDNVFSHAE